MLKNTNEDDGDGGCPTHRSHGNCVLPVSPMPDPDPWQLCREDWQDSNPSTPETVLAHLLSRMHSLPSPPPWSFSAQQRHCCLPLPRLSQESLQVLWFPFSLAHHWCQSQLVLSSFIPLNFLPALKLGETCRDSSLGLYNASCSFFPHV